MVPLGTEPEPAPEQKTQEELENSVRELIQMKLVRGKQNAG